MADFPAQARRALANIPVAEALVPPMREAIGGIVEAEVQNGFTVTSNGAIHVNLVTEMTDVTPARSTGGSAGTATAPSATSSGAPAPTSTRSGRRSPPRAPPAAAATGAAPRRSTSTWAAR